MMKMALHLFDFFSFFYFFTIFSYCFYRKKDRRFQPIDGTAGYFVWWSDDASRIGLKFNSRWM